MAEQKLPPFQRITIIGVGLIGGSLALAIKHRFPAIYIIGVDKPQILKRALKRNMIDIAERSVERAVHFCRSHYYSRARFRNCETSSYHCQEHITSCHRYRYRKCKTCNS